MSEEKGLLYTSPGTPQGKNVKLSVDILTYGSSLPLRLPGLRQWLG